VRQVIGLVVAVGLIISGFAPGWPAEAASNDVLQRALRFLELYQDAGGSWSGPTPPPQRTLSPWEVTPVVVAALLWAGEPADGDTLRQGLGWVRSHAGDAATVQIDSWTVLALSLAGDRELAVRVSERLLN